MPSLYKIAFVAEPLIAVELIVSAAGGVALHVPSDLRKPEHDPLANVATMSEYAAILGIPVLVVFFRIPVANPESAVPLMRATVLFVEIPVTSPDNWTT